MGGRRKRAAAPAAAAAAKPGGGRTKKAPAAQAKGRGAKGAVAPTPPPGDVASGKSAGAGAEAAAAAAAATADAAAAADALASAVAEKDSLAAALAAATAAADTRSSLLALLTEAATSAVAAALSDTLLARTEAAVEGAAANAAAVESALTQSTKSAASASKRAAALAAALGEEQQQRAVLAQRLALSERLVSTREAELADARDGAVALSPLSADVMAFAAGSAAHSTGHVRLLLAGLCLYPALAAPFAPAPSVVAAVAEAVASGGAGAGAGGSGAAAPPVGWPTALAAVVAADAAHDPAAAVTHYGALWRSLATPGRRGWRGEILAAVTGGMDVSLVADAATRPALRDALRSDLRSLHALYNTDPRELRRWLLDGLGGDVAPPSFAPPSVPVYTESFAALGGGMGGLTPGVDASGVAAGEGVVAASPLRTLITSLQAAPDWGADAIVDELVAYVADGGVEAAAVGAEVCDAYWALRWEGGAAGSLVGAVSVDEVLSADPLPFVGVEDIRRRLVRNTEFLLSGLKAQNVLLYGSPGVGKSAMVRSLLPELAPRGLRIIELQKADLCSIPTILERLAPLPFCFILFIDDLTFEESEAEEMRAGKAALDGSMRVAAPNVTVVATSNRRFPVGSRLTDGTQERLAFAYRFGLVLAFPVTNRDQFKAIVRALGVGAGLLDTTDDDALDAAALTWALGQDGNSNGMSGRTARQFVEYVAAERALYGDAAEMSGSAGNVNAGAVPANSEWVN